LLNDGADIYEVSGHTPKHTINLINGSMIKHTKAYDDIYNIVNVQTKTMSLSTLFLFDSMIALPIRISSLEPNQLPIVEQSPRHIHLPVAHQN